MQEISASLAAAIDDAVPGWVERSVRRLLMAFFGRAEPSVMAEAGEAGRRAAADVGPRIRELLRADIDEQSTNPLSILRGAVVYPTEVLRRAGVPAVVRDDFAERQFPDDDYDLTPARFADIDQGLVELGIVWGATKAKAHLDRHRPGTA